ncbi:hypothetical protein GGI20_000962 [Coemansia sp. BCRC 34301]|nr:hypothetical protein GGI20_000962 [Coemansia sp. BCRC 34301]
MIGRYALLALLLGGSALAKSPSIRGLDPHFASHYNPLSNFTCLDGQRTIPFAWVNDDYCDCTDGSDEPGTSACNTGTFYCANVGHTPAHLSKSKVNDGVCDDECCDGSDEYDSGITCVNRCVEMGQLAAAEAERLRGVVGRGARRRKELVGLARGLRKTRGDELLQKEEELKKTESEYVLAEARKTELEEAESRRLKEHSDKRMDLANLRLPDLVTYRRALAAELHGLRGHRDSLIRLLRSVRVGHNAEYNDEAVAQLIADYDAFTETYPYIEASAMEYADEGSMARKGRELRLDNDGEADDSDFDKCRLAVNIFVSERDTLVDHIEALAGMLRALRDGYNRNYHDLAVKAAVVGFTDYEAAPWAENEGLQMRFAEATAAYDALQDASPLAPPIPHSMADDDFVAPPVPTVPDTNQELADARAAYWALQSTKNTLTSEISSLKTLLQDTDLGPDDVYLALKDECVTLDAGEYTYEVCILGGATQISNKDQTRQNLGSFAGVDGIVHRYRGGAKCWNGPERSLSARFVCAEDVAILSIAEPEKCEYVAQMTAPFVCDLSEPETEHKAPIRIEHDEL